MCRLAGCAGAGVAIASATGISAEETFMSGYILIGAIRASA